MSLLVSTAIADLQQETETVGVQISDSEMMLAFNRANKYFMSSYKMPTTEREANLLTFSDVHEYSVPSDFVGLIEPRKPYTLSSPNFQHETANEFAHHHYGKATAFKFNRETRFLIVNDDTEGVVRLHDFDSVSDNGSWTVSGDGASLAKDKQIFSQGEASLRFTLTGSGGTTTLVNSTFTAVDLTDYKDIAYLFLDLICPAANTAAITSLRLRIGSSASAYWEMTATTRHRGDAINAGAGLIGFDWSGATETGSPTISAVTYAQILITNPTSGVNGTYRIDNLFAALPTYYLMPYYSLYNVKTSANAYQESITATNDTILCPAEFNEVYPLKALEILAVYNLKNTALAQYAADQLKDREMSLKSTYPNQQSRTQSTYYKRHARF